MPNDNPSPTTEPLLEGRYANYIEIGHNAAEIVLVFGQFYTAQERPLMHTRIITSPQRARAFFETLRLALERYETAFGAIAVESGGGTP